MNNKSWKVICRDGYTHKLMTTVSAVVLTFALSEVAQAADTDAPMVWLEGGWHYQAVKETDEPFLPSFANLIPSSGLSDSPSSVQRPLAYSYGADGKILFRPENSDWIFSAAFTYGRAQGHKRIHAETAPGSATLFQSIPAFDVTYAVKIAPLARRAIDFSGSNKESHVIVDFSAGKDVGIGMFGVGRSAVDIGIRFAQFRSRSSAQLFADPDFHVSYYHETFKTNFRSQFVTVYEVLPNPVWHNDYSSAIEKRRFEGLGPSISWNSSVPIAGNLDDAALDVDWSVNAALLFGRQKTRSEHKTTAEYHNKRRYFDFNGHKTCCTAVGPIDRSHRVTVPNIGGFAGMSLQWANAKVSIGYRGDFFFGAIDGGIDTRRATTRGFYGPFASISVGVSPFDF